MDENYREVNFAVYCPKCKDVKTSENREPCDSCLAEPWNINSEKPRYFEEGKNVD